MDKNEVKQSLQRAASQLPRADVNTLWEMPIRPLPEHDYITRPEPVPRRSQKQRMRSFATAMACFCVIFMGGFAWYGQNLAMDSVVTLDVNPSIEITANRREKVLSVKALNADAEVLLDGRKYRGWDVVDTVESLTLSLQNEGYLAAESNTVLLSVNGKNQTQADALAQDLSNKIRLKADKAETPTTVLRHTGKIDKQLQKQAKAQGISAGKLALINELQALLPQQSREELAGLSVEALTELVRSLAGQLSQDTAVDSSRYATQEQIQPPLDDDDDVDDDDDDEYDNTASGAATSVTSQTAKPGQNQSQKPKQDQNTATPPNQTKPSTTPNQSWDNDDGNDDDDDDDAPPASNNQSNDDDNDDDNDDRNDDTDDDDD